MIWEEEEKEEGNLPVVASSETGTWRHYTDLTILRFIPLQELLNSKRRTNRKMGGRDSNPKPVSQETPSWLTDSRSGLGRMMRGNENEAVDGEEGLSDEKEDN
jgi:hypothetical protein